MWENSKLFSLVESLRSRICVKYLLSFPQKKLSNSDGIVDPEVTKGGIKPILLHCTDKKGYLVTRFHNMRNQFWAVGCWSGLDCEIIGSEPIMSNFFGPFFSLFRGQNFFFEKLHRKKVKKKKNGKFFFYVFVFFID